MRRLAAAAALVFFGAAAVGLAASSGADPVLAFADDFSTNDFAARFDYGYSGISALSYSDGITTFSGNHDMGCGSADTSRDVHLTGTAAATNFDELFWYCAPGGDPAKGHLMTGLDTKGYSTAWFSPKDAYTGITKVCWDISEQAGSRRMWYQVLFVGADDATRYPAGTPTESGGIPSVARGTGGFDLGYTNPNFRQLNPNNGIFPDGGTLAGFVDVDSSSSWFQNQDTFSTYIDKNPPTPLAGTDKSTRFRHCLEQTGPTTITETFDVPPSVYVPDGHATRTLTGVIPQDARRVVFEHDEYDPGKDDRYSPDMVTWHWDNIQIFTATGAPPPATTAAATTTVAPTVTVAETTTTTPPPACPPDFSAAQMSWCEEVNARLHALDGG